MDAPPTAGAVGVGNGDGRRKGVPFAPGLGLGAPAWVVLAVGLLATSFGWWQADIAERRATGTVIVDANRHLATELQRELDAMELMTEALVAHFESSEVETRAEFARFADRILARNAAVRGAVRCAVWCRALTGDGVAEAEKEARAIYGPEFSFHGVEAGTDGSGAAEPGPGGRLVVWFSAAPAGAAPVPGLSLGTVGAPSAPLNAALAGARAAVTRSNPLVTTEPEPGRSVFVASPVYSPAENRDRPALRPRSVAGFVVVAIDVDALFSRVVSQAEDLGYTIEVTDLGEGSPASGRPPWEERVGLGNVSWGVRCAGIDRRFRSPWPLRPEAVLVAGLLGTLLLALFVGLASGRTALRRLIETRTGDLSASNTALAAEVADRRKVEEALRESDRFLNKAQEVAHVGSWISEPTIGGRLTWSAETCRIFGIDPARFDGKVATFFDRVHPEDLDMVRDLAQLSLQTGAEYAVDHRIIRLDGAVRWVHERAEIERGPDGSTVRMIGVVQDITEARDAREALRASEERYRAFVSQSTEAIWRFELRPPVPVDLSEDEFLARGLASGHLAECNEAFARMYGASSVDELIGKAIHEFMPLDHPANIDSRRQFYRSGFRLSDWESFERALDGSSRIFVNNALGIVENGCLARVWGTQRDVTESRAAQLAVAENESRYRQLFNTNQAIKLVIDPEGGAIVDANEAAAEFYGYSMEELKTRTFGDIATDPGPAVASMLRNAAVQRGRFETVHRLAGGQTRDVEIYTGPLELHGGRFVFSIIHDITDRKRIEAALQTSERTNRALLEAMPDVMFRMDRRGVYLACHAPAEAVLLLSPGEFIGRSCQEVLPPHMAAQCYGALRRVFETGTPQTYEYVAPKRPGAPSDPVRHFEVRMVRAGEDEALLVVRNITDRKESERQLNESRERLRLLLDRAPIGVIAWDANFRVTEWNPAAETIFGYSAAEAIGRHAWFIVAEGARGYVGEVWRSVNSGAGGFRATNENLTAQGRTILCDWFNAPMVNASGEVVGIASMVQDVTERRRAENRQQLMLRELDHRVKNNLAAVVSLAEQTIRHSADMAEFAETFQGRIRAMARMHAVLARTHWEQASLRSVIEQSLEVYKDGRLARVTLDGPDQKLPAWAVSPIAMAMYELATNAVKYGALSVESGMVTVRWSRESEEPMGPSLVIEWIETGGPPVSPPKQRGFGSDLIEGGIAYELHGRATIEFNPSGLRCRLVMPITERWDRSSAFAGSAP